MSEITPEELIEEIEYEVEDADVIPMPIDPTLSNSGEAADAKATGDAIAAVISNLRVNAKAPTDNAIILYATDIAMSDAVGASTIAEAVTAAENRDADDIMYDAGNLVTIKDALDDIYTTIDSELETEDIDAILEEVFGGDD